MTHWIGIDPGQTGGLAYLREDGSLWEAAKMPAISHEVDAIGLYHLLSNWTTGGSGVKVAIEQVHSMPGQGVSSTFKFGKNFGIAIGVVAAMQLPLHRVPPQTWKKSFSLTGKDKDASRGKASELWPDMAEHWRFKNLNGISDAALIAECARRAGL
jgi:crossover junction endodeoxyribonuclease RuvC